MLIFSWSTKWFTAMFVLGSIGRKPSGSLFRSQGRTWKTLGECVRWWPTNHVTSCPSSPRDTSPTETRHSTPEEVISSLSHHLMFVSNIATTLFFGQWRLKNLEFWGTFSEVQKPPKYIRYEPNYMVVEFVYLMINFFWSPLAHVLRSSWFFLYESFVIFFRIPWLYSSQFVVYHGTNMKLMWH